VPIILVAIAVTSVAIMVTASALNTISASKNETDPRRNGSAASVHYGIAHNLYAERQQDISARTTAGAVTLDAGDVVDALHAANCRVE